MSITRSFAGFLSSSSNPRKWDILLPTGVAVRRYGKGYKAPAKEADDHHPVDLPTVKKFSEHPPPTQIPFQPKIANSVNIGGIIDSGVKLHQLPNGSFTSVLVLVHKKMKTPGDFSRFMIPVVFQGDLAEIAACYLKKNDHIFVSGQLTSDNLPFMQKDANENIKLIAHSVNFVKEASSQKGGQCIHKQDEVSTSDSAAMKTSDNVVKTSSEFGGGNFRNPTRSNSHRDQLWKKFVENPEQFWDNRLRKTKTTQPDFRHKEDGEGLWLNSAPAWVVPKLPPQMDDVAKSDLLKG